MVPQIQTDRLLLRAHVAADHGALWAMRNHPDVYRHLGGEPSTEEASWRRLLASAGHWVLMGYGYWLMEERGTGRVVGECGFSEFHRDISPPLVGTLEAGWILGADFHGKGYASEAMNAILNWAENTYPGRPLTCIINTENAPSIRLAERLGFRAQNTQTYLGGDCVIMRMSTVGS